MLSFLLSLLANNVIYPLIVPGIAAGLVTIIFSFFIPTSLLQYKMPALLGGSLLVLFFVFYAGKYASESKLAVDIANQKAEIAALKAKSNEITIDTVTKYVDRIKVVEVTKTEYQNVYVESLIPKSVDVELPIGFKRLHDAAAEGGIPGAPGSTDAGPSGIKLTTATKTITGNYLTCHATEEQLKSLQSWVRQQQELYKK